MEENQEKQASVLIVEDDRILSKMYSEKFSMEGFKVDVVYDGESFLEQVKQKPFDFVLLDLLLPKLEGLDALETLRQSEEGQKVPVIALTNLADPVERERAFRLGVKEYLVKAMQTPEDVVHKVKKHLA